MSRSLVVLGARNLGGAILDHALAAGWRCAAIVRSQETADAVTARGAFALRADATNPTQLDAAIRAARDELGSLEVIVNAASPGARSGGTFGGGPLVDTTQDDFARYCLGVAQGAYAFLHVGARELLAERDGGALIQVTGGSARRPIAERGAWAAGAAATRALTLAAAQELRAKGVHVALLVCDGIIDSAKTHDLTRHRPKQALLRQQDVAAAVLQIAEQHPRGWTHELVLTPAEERWVP